MSSITIQMTALPKINIEIAEPWECHLDGTLEHTTGRGKSRKVVPEETHLWLPFYLMGACGDAKCMTGNAVIQIDLKKGMDAEFWGRVASALKKRPMFDWDWNSMAKNVITPNLEHIRLACNIQSDTILERFEEDGYVFLNNWFDTDMEKLDDDEEGKPQYVRNPNRNSVFTYENATEDGGGGDVEY